MNEKEIRNLNNFKIKPLNIEYSKEEIEKELWDKINFDNTINKIIKEKHTPDEINTLEKFSVKRKELLKSMTKEESLELIKIYNLKN